MLLNQGSIGKLALYQHLVSGQTWWTSRIQASGVARVQEMNTPSNRLLADSINGIRCSASERRWFPARPAQHVHRRRNHGKGPIHSALASAHGRNGERRGETCNAGRAGAYRPSEALHPTRSSDVLPRIARERVPTIDKPYTLC